MQNVDKSIYNLDKSVEKCIEFPEHVSPIRYIYGHMGTNWPLRSIDKFAWICSIDKIGPICRQIRLWDAIWGARILIYI